MMMNYYYLMYVNVSADSSSPPLPGKSGYSIDALPPEAFPQGGQGASVHPTNAQEARPPPTAASSQADSTRVAGSTQSNTSALPERNDDECNANSRSEEQRAQMSRPDSPPVAGATEYHIDNLPPEAFPQEEQQNSGKSTANASKVPPSSPVVVGASQYSLDNLPPEAFPEQSNQKSPQKTGQDMESFDTDISMANNTGGGGYDLDNLPASAFPEGGDSNKDTGASIPETNTTVPLAERVRTKVRQRVKRKFGILLF